MFACQNQLHILALFIYLPTIQLAMEKNILLFEPINTLYCINSPEPLLLTADLLKKKLAHQKRREILNQKKSKYLVRLPLFCEAAQECINPEYDDLGNLLIPLFDENEAQHKKVGPYACTYCQKDFTQSSSLKNHLRIHKGEKPHICTYCKKSFTQLVSLKTHVRIHTLEKPYTCKVCGKSFRQSSNLQVHLRTHSDEKPYICNFPDCGKAFKHSNALNNHKRIHTGEKPYTCTYCDKSFTQLATLKTHVRTHTGEKPYTCEVCGKAFSQESNLTRHLKIHA